MAKTLANLLLFGVLGALLLGVTGCGPNLYELPEPPPRELWRRHSLSPAQDEERSHEDFLAAQRTILDFVQAMQEERWEDAYRLLSNETRILLDDLSPDGLGETVLAEGLITRDGNEYHIDPIDLFAIRDLAEIVDEQAGETEAETYRRKEVWAVSSEGDVHHVVLIFEEDGWRIHKTQIDLTPGAPGRRSPES